MKEISLTQGYVALVDDEDYGRVVSTGPWIFSTDKKRGMPHLHRYAYRNKVFGTRSRKGQTELLHRFVLKVSDPQIKIDHENCDGLDCQKTNLRQCDNRQNQGNRRKQFKPSSSRFKGVCWDKSRNKWMANGTEKHKGINLGRFASEIRAAVEYDWWALGYFKEFARTNFSLCPLTIAKEGT